MSRPGSCPWILVATAVLLAASGSAAAKGRPRPARCAIPRGSVFESVDLLDAGVSPEGPVRGRWTLRLEGASYHWTWSDHAESGRVRCTGRVLQARGPAGRRAGTYDPRKRLLRWEGRLYRAAAGRADPPPLTIEPEDPARPPSPPPPYPPGARRDGHQIPALGKDDQERRGCATHDDCVISCDVDGDCCGQSCGCGNPLNRAFAGRLRAYLERNCDGRRSTCPAVGCALRPPGTALCREGLCVRVAGPGAGG